MTMMKMTIRSKTENRSLPSYPSSPTNPNVCPPTTHTVFVIHVYPSSSALFLWGKTVPDGWAEWSCHTLFFPPPSWTESHQTPSTSPTPRPRGSQAAQHSTISLSIPLYVMYSRVRTLGVVSSFGSVLLILCWMNFLLLGLLFQFFFVFYYFILFHTFPYKIIAIAAVQPASHDF